MHAIGMRFPALWTLVAAIAIVAACSMPYPAAWADGPGGDLVAAQAELQDGKAGGLQGSDVEMLRMYNPNSGEHFYTADAGERDDLVKAGWIYEGVGWIAPKSSGVPVYRLYNPYGGEHHYTMDPTERTALVVEGWSDEGVGWRSAGPGQPRVGVYRDYNPNAFSNNHNYTVDSDEHASLAEAGWSGEGGGWYALAQDDAYDEGWVLDGSDWRYYRKGDALKAEWVVAPIAPAIVGASSPGAGLQRFWVDAEGSLALSRIVDPSSDRDKDAGYLAYARDAGYVVRGKWDNQEGRVYVADNEGRLPDGSGWLVTDAYDGAWQRYYLDGDMHAAVTGAFSVDGSRYFGIGGEGYVAHNVRLELDGAWMWADNDGVLSPDAVVTALVAAAQGYSSPSQYLIMVDIDDPCTVVLEGSMGDWSVKYVWDCCTGAPETPTVTGVFSVGIKGYSFGEGHGYSCYYYTQFFGDYLFHTRKYYAYTHDLLDGRMNQRVSEGCVRLYDEDAIWIQDNVPEGTTVVTMM